MDKEVFKRKVGERVKELRIAAGFKSYDEFCIAKGLERNVYSRAETGKNITLDTFADVLTALNVTPEEFFKDFSDNF